LGGGDSREGNQKKQEKKRHCKSIKVPPLRGEGISEGGKSASRETGGGKCSSGRRENSHRRTKHRDLGGEEEGHLGKGNRELPSGGGGKKRKGHLDSYEGSMTKKGQVEFPRKRRAWREKESKKRGKAMGGEQVVKNFRSDQKTPYELLRKEKRDLRVEKR